MPKIRARLISHLLFFAFFGTVEADFCISNRRLKFFTTAITFCLRTPSNRLGRHDKSKEKDYQNDGFLEQSNTRNKNGCGKNETIKIPGIRLETAPQNVAKITNFFPKIINFKLYD